MATVKYRINVRQFGTRSSGIDSPMRATIDEAVEAYKGWGKRPTEGRYILEGSVRDPNGEWVFLDGENFQAFLALCNKERFSEMYECRHRYDNPRENVYG